MVIRQATIEDIPQLIPLAHAFVSESKQLRPLNEGHWIAAWQQLIGSGMAVMFLIEDEDGIHGGIGGARWPDQLSGEWVATEYHWYVYPNYRGHGIGLYREFEKWAREHDCVEIRMAHLSDSMPERVSRFYKLSGFVSAETLFVKQLEAA